MTENTTTADPASIPVYVVTRHTPMTEGEHTETLAVRTSRDAARAVAQDELTGPPLVWDAYGHAKGYRGTWYAVERFTLI